jgi:riboflavin synthase
VFTGIIENLGKVSSIEKNRGNIDIVIESAISGELKIDQSVAHNGVCLTVVDLGNNNYTVTAIKETISKTNFGALQVGDSINLERSVKLGDRLDGHLVQGHVDQTGECIHIENQNGSWLFTFKYNAVLGNLTIEKGSITINGVSLTVVNSKLDSFSVAIIPYTYEHTNFRELKIGGLVNLEFDVIGKYVSKLQKLRS